MDSIMSDLQYFAGCYRFVSGFELVERSRAVLVTLSSSFVHVAKNQHLFVLSQGLPLGCDWLD